MKEKLSLVELLEICAESGIDEVILEKPQNRFLEVALQNSDPLPTKQKKASQDFVKPIFSTSQALSTLAKKNQKTNEENAFSLNREEKFLSLNEIVEQARSAAKASKSLAELRKAVENFDGCNLKKMATNTVFCDGSSNSKVMVLGEAPGNHEDLQGIPFCGDSGLMLDEMLRAINLTRVKNFYISNVIFWRPPGNRRPTEEELAICRPFVERHIQLLNPEVLLLVGATAMSAVLGVNDPITKIRGQLLDFSPEFLPRTIKTFTIFHPSYLMRQPSKKKVAWQDMLTLESFLKDLGAY
jgi:DNA polymerase